MTNHKDYFFKNILSTNLNERKKVNSQYSIRAFANYLNLSSSSLSDILKAKRCIPLYKINDITDKLNLTEQEIKLFNDSIFQWKKDNKNRNKKEVNKPLILETELYEDIIKSWIYPSIFVLSSFKDFELTPKNISLKLNIPLEQANQALDTLIDSGLLIEDENRIIQSNRLVETTTDVPSKAIQESHYEGLDIARKKLQETPIELRDFSSMTFLASKEKLPALKKAIQKFKQELVEIGEASSEQEVYRASIQLFPLSCDLKPENIH